MTISDVSWRKLWWIIAVPIVGYVAVLTAYVVKFSNGLSNDQAVWGQLGDYIGGIVNPLISLIGLLAVVWTLRSNVVILGEMQRQLRAQMFAESELQFVTLEQLFAKVPSALKFHGINESELKEAGVTPDEFAYLMANFTAGGVNVRALWEEDIKPFEKGDYYRTMMESIHTRKAWPIIRQLMAPSPYKERLQATYDVIRKETEESSSS